MDALWNAFVAEGVKNMPLFFAGCMTLFTTAVAGYKVKQKLLLTAAKDAAVEAEKLIGPGQGPLKKKKANDLLGKTWHGRMTTQMNMQTLIQEHGMKEVDRRASLVPQPNPETDDTK